MHFDQHRATALFLIAVLCVCCGAAAESVYTDDGLATNEDSNDYEYDINDFLKQHGIDEDHLERFQQLQNLKKERKRLRRLEDDVRDLRDIKEGVVNPEEDKKPIKDDDTKNLSGDAGKSTNDYKLPIKSGNTVDSHGITEAKSTAANTAVPSNVYTKQKPKSKIAIEMPDNSLGVDGYKSNKGPMNTLHDKSSHTRQQHPKSQDQDTKWKEYQYAKKRYNRSVNANNLLDGMFPKTSDNNKQSARTSNDTDDDTSDYDDDDEYDADDEDDRTHKHVLKNISVKKIDMVVPLDKRTEGDFKDHMIWIAIGSGISTVITILAYLIFRLIIYIRKRRGCFLKDISLGPLADRKLDQPMYVRLSQVHNAKTGNHYVVSILDDKKEENGWSSEEEEVFNISAIKEQRNNSGTPVLSMTPARTRSMTSTPKGTPTRSYKLP